MKAQNTILIGCKTFCTVLTLLVIIINVKAQDTLGIPEKNEYLGVDFTFINRFIPLEETIGLKSDYDLYYIKLGKGNYAYRHGLDFRYSYEKDEEHETEPRTSKIFQINYKLGLAKYKDLSKKFRLLYGLDFQAKYGRSVISNSFNINPSQSGESVRTVKQFEGGVGPFWGLIYHINSHVSIYTEMGYYLTLSGRNLKHELSVNQVDPEVDKQLFLRADFIYPTSLVIFYNF